MIYIIILAPIAIYLAYKTLQVLWIAQAHIRYGYRVNEYNKIHHPSLANKPSASFMGRLNKAMF